MSSWPHQVPSQYTAQPFSPDEPMAYMIYALSLPVSLPTCQRLPAAASGVQGLPLTLFSGLKLLSTDLSRAAGAARPRHVSSPSLTTSRHEQGTREVFTLHFIHSTILPSSAFFFNSSHHPTWRTLQQMTAPLQTILAPNPAMIILALSSSSATLTCRSASGLPEA